MRASVESRTTAKDQWSPTSTDSQVVPAPNLPAFPKHAVIDSSNPRFKGFVKTRESKTEPTAHDVEESSSERDLEQVLAENRRGNFIKNRESLLPPPRSEDPNMLAASPEDGRHSRRTSFSFSITNPDAYDPEVAAFNSHSRLGDAPMSTMNVAKFNENQNQGTYRPKGAPAKHDV